VSPAPASAPPGAPGQGADVGRRRFFRAFASELIETAAMAAGAAQALQRASAEAASAILDPGLLGAAAPEPLTSTEPSGFRTPFREDGGLLYIIDQRKLPDVLEEFPCRSAGEASYAIREMIVRGAPAIGQVAAIAMAMSAENMRDSMPYARRATLRGGANALINARPTAINLRWAVDRMMARYESIGDLSDDGGAIADGMREEADAIVFEATTDHGRMASFGLQVLPVPADRPVEVLTHCNTGPLAAGQFGTALGVVQAAAEQRGVHGVERAVPHRLENRARADLHAAGDDQNGAGAGRHDPTRALHAVHHRHHDVHQDQIGRVLGAEIHRLGAVSRHPHDTVQRIAAHDPPQQIGNAGQVVDDADPHASGSPIKSTTACSSVSSWKLPLVR